MNSIPTHDQSIALSDSGHALVLALLHSHRESLETHFKRKLGGRTRRPTPGDMELAREFELTIQLISQLEEAAAHHNAAE